MDTCVKKERHTPNMISQILKRLSRIERLEKGIYNSLKNPKRNVKLYGNPIGLDAKWLFDEKKKMSREGLNPTAITLN